MSDKIQLFTYKQLEGYSEFSQVFDVSKKPSLVVNDYNADDKVIVFEIKNIIDGMRGTAISTVYAILNEKYYIGVFDLSHAFLNTIILKNYHYEDYENYLRKIIDSKLTGPSRQFYNFLMKEQKIDPDEFTVKGRSSYLKLAKELYETSNSNS